MKKHNRLQLILEPTYPDGSELPIYKVIDIRRVTKIWYLFYKLKKLLCKILGIKLDISEIYLSNHERLLFSGKLCIPIDSKIYSQLTDGCVQYIENSAHLNNMSIVFINHAHD